MSNIAIWPIDRTLSGATTPGQSGLGSDGNEEVLHIPQSSSFTGASLSHCLISYPGYSLGDSYPFAEMQSMYSTVPTSHRLVNMIICFQLSYTINIQLQKKKPTGFCIIWFNQVLCCQKYTFIHTWKAIKTLISHFS